MSIAQIDISGILGIATGENVIVGLFSSGNGSLPVATLNATETIAGQASYAASGTVSLADGSYWTEARAGSAGTTVAFNAATNQANLRRTRAFYGQLAAGVWIGGAINQNVEVVETEQVVGG